MTIIAHGQLKHHFWGTYSATIVLVFHSLELAQAAQTAAFPNWSVETNGTSHALRFFGKNPQLASELQNLYQHGADKNKVNSIRYSIDWGEKFSVNINLTPAPVETQLTLELL